MADGEDGTSAAAAAPPSRALSVLPPLVYMVLSALLSVTNRYIYHDRRPAFHMPALLITVQAIVVGLLTTAGLSSCWRSRCRQSAYWPSRIKFWDAVRLSAVAACFALDVVLTQAALVLAPVALVEVVKCLVPAVVLAETAWLVRRLPRACDVVTVAIVCLGVVLATRGGAGVAPGQLEPGGLLLSAGSAAAAGTRLVASQALLKSGTHEPCPTPLLLGYVSPALFATGGASFLTFELRDVDVSPPPPALRAPHLAGTAALVMLSSCLAFALNLSELWCISAGSAMVLTLAGALKTVLFVVFSALATGGSLSLEVSAGSVLAAFGVAFFKIGRPSSARRSSVDSERVEMRSGLVAAENAASFGG